MLRFGVWRVMLGLSTAAVVVASCGSDDGKRTTRGSEAGEAGQGGQPGLAAGGSMQAAGEAGQPTTGGGMGGEAPLPMGGAPGAGAGGEPPLAGAPSAGQGGAGEPAPVSLCGPGKYDDGESGCVDCVEAPATVPITCKDFYMPSLISDGGPLSIYLDASVTKREPLAVDVKVSYVSPDQSEDYPFVFEPSDGHWQIDVSPGPDDPFQVI